jgi:hypothetical protein
MLKVLNVFGLISSSYALGQSLYNKQPNQWAFTSMCLFAVVLMQLMEISKLRKAQK